MKLIGVYIENFGGLHQFSLTFSEGLTTLCQPNGFGKTTLAEFIRAMFYGFPRKGRNLEKSLREKYTPWQGGVWGGNLVFSHEGHTYRLERTFGPVPKQDTFALIDLETGKKSRRFSENIGMELFGLDAESFARSAYLPQIGEKGSLTTAAIQAKLSNLVEDEEDIGNFDRAVAALKAARSMYLPYRGTGGEAARAGEQLARLREEESRLLGKREELERLEARLPQLQAELEENRTLRGQLAVRIRQASERESAEGIRREYGGLVRRREELQHRRDGLLARYGGAMPEEQALPAWQEKLDRVRQLRRERTEILENLAEMTVRGTGIGRLVLWIAAVCGILTGVVLAAMEYFPWAWAILGAGVLLWIGALLSGKNGARELRMRRERLLAQAEEKARDAAALERAVQEQLGLRSMQDIRTDCREFRETEAALDQISREIEALRRTYGDLLNRPGSEPRESLDMLQEQERQVLERMEQLSAALAEQRRNRDLLARELGRLNSLEAEHSRWQQRLTRCREQAELLDDTVNFLYQARENLQTGYLEPLRTGFAGYMAQLAGEDAGGILVTPELEVQLERGGQSRRMGYFSAGQTDLVMLCMRLALVDALFAREEPVVILDDPFVNLDDDHMVLALRMLRVLARDRQILYMTCSESRTPK